jgi:hypothetical protein
MAKLRFIRGTITGRLGEFVGSRWKGINYIKTFTPPSNPRTDKQQGVRLVFKKLSNWAKDLYRVGCDEWIPQRPRMTIRNSIFQANKIMLTNKMFNPTNLQVTIPNTSDISSIASNSKCVITATGVVRLLLQVPTTLGVALDRFTASLIVYSALTETIVLHEQEPMPMNGNIPITEMGSVPVTALSNYRAFVVFWGENAEGKKLITQTFPLTLSAT